MNQRLSAVTTSVSVQELANMEEGITELLQSIGVNPVKYGDESLTALCFKRQWNEEELLKWIKTNRNLYKSGSETELPHENLKQWCTFLEKTYYKPTEEFIDEMRREFRGAKKNGGKHLQWFEREGETIQKFFDKLEMYKQFERDKLFPLIIELENKKTKILYGAFKSLQRALKITEQDQLIILDSISEIELSMEGLSEPEDNGTGVSVFQSNLQDLFAAVKKQLLLERETFYPLVKQRIRKLNL